RQVIVAVDDPGIAGSTGKQRELTDGDDASIVIGGAADDIADLIDETEVCALDHALAWTAFAFAAVACWPSFPRHCGACHGRVHPAVRQSLDLCLSLLRPHCHSWLSWRPVAARAGGALLPSGRRRRGGGQPSLAASPASRRSGSTFTPSSRCYNASPCRSPSARCAIPASRS